MPVIRGFSLPGSPAGLPVVVGKPFFIAFLASKDPATNEAWCPDVRAAQPVLDATFSGPSSPEVAYVEVGQKAEWKDLNNVYRSQWAVNAVPALIRYEKTEGSLVQEVGRLLEGEILDQEKLQKLVSA